MVMVQRNGEKTMELKIYKGFDLNFLDQLDDTPLITNSLESKKNVLLFDKKIKKQLDIALLGLDDDESAWITYEEYTPVSYTHLDVYKRQLLEGIKTDESHRICLSS